MADRSVGLLVIFGIRDHLGESISPYCRLLPFTLDPMVHHQLYPLAILLAHRTLEDHYPLGRYKTSGLGRESSEEPRIVLGAGKEISKLILFELPPVSFTS